MAKSKLDQAARLALRIRAEIDWNIIMIERHQKSINGRSVMDTMIDEATGHDKEQCATAIAVIQRLHTLWTRFQLVTGQDMSSHLESSSRFLHQVEATDG